jgi:hypothetical protein
LIIRSELLDADLFVYYIKFLVVGNQHTPPQIDEASSYYQPIDLS